MNEPSILHDSEKQWNQKGALEEIENLKNIRATAWDEHTHSFRWIMATLSVMNGGACLAILDQDKLDAETTLVASGLFVIGILMALLVAVFGQHSIQKSLVPLQKQIGYWMTVVEDGERDEGLEGQLNDELRSSVTIGWASRISGWLAAMAFVSGACVSGYGLAQSDLATSKNKVGAEEMKNIK